MANNNTSNSHCIILWFSGIQLADELGFKESLSTLEQNSKRRSVNGFPVPGSFEPLQSVPQKNNHAVSIYNTIRTFVIGMKYYHTSRFEIISWIVYYLTVVVGKCRHRFTYTAIIIYTHVVFASRSFAKSFVTFYYYSLILYIIYSRPIFQSRYCEVPGCLKLFSWHGLWKNTNSACSIYHCRLYCRGTYTETRKHRLQSMFNIVNYSIRFTIFLSWFRKLYYTFSFWHYFLFF